MAFLAITRIGVIREELRRLLAAFGIQLVEKLRHLDGIVAGFGHDVRTHEVGLALSRSRELQQHAVGANSDTDLRQLSHHPAASARNLSSKHGRQLDEIGFGSLIGAVPQDHVRHLVTHHTRKLRLVVYRS